MMTKKFIKTIDEQTANKLISVGFKLVSHIGQVYVFLNELPKNFQFSEIDTKQIAYSNILNI